jgi:hypothetical protein
VSAEVGVLRMIDDRRRMYEETGNSRYLDQATHDAESTTESRNNARSRKRTITKP